MPNLLADSSLPDAPSPPWLPVIGSLLEFRGSPFQTMLDWQRRYGDVVRYRLGPRLFHMVSHPALAEVVLLTEQDRFIKMYEPDNPAGIALVLGQGLVTSRGELWKRQRRLMQPLFQRSRLPGFADEIGVAGSDLVARWWGLSQGEPVNVAHEMMRTTLEVITRSMFSTTVLNRLDMLSPALLTVLRYSSDQLSNPLRLPLWAPTPGNRAFTRALRLLDDQIGALIQERRGSTLRCDDLLDKLLHARDPDSGVAMDDRQIRDECLTVFIAGHETTAVALAWSWYFLATHRDARERLHAELDKVLNGRVPTLNDLPALPITRAILEEAMRLYPPAVGVIRKTTEELGLGGCRIPKDSLVFVNVANIHRHADFWDDPDSFRPERFFPDHPALGHRLAYMPFGAGPRVCLGNHFAVTEGVLLLATLAQVYCLDLAAGQTVEPEIVLTLRPKGGLWMRITKRRSIRH